MAKQVVSKLLILFNCIWKIKTISENRLCRLMLIIMLIIILLFDIDMIIYPNNY